MARRMFSPEVTSNDIFLDMPTSTQALYFHLGMNADDDGFVGPKKVMRMIGSSDDDLKILLLKQFVIPFESGVVVIRHWRVNNYVRRDWYRPTIHEKEKEQLKITKNAIYCLVDEMLPNRQHSVDIGSKLVSKLVKEQNEEKIGSSTPNMEHIEEIKDVIRRKYGK